jgi:ATP-dependent RNA helicase DDX55/SPB4
LQALDKKLIKTQVGAIVISPTRELARQTFGVIKKFTAVIPDLHPILLVGGSDTTADMYKCAEHGCNIMVATPGRLLDVLNRASLSDDISFKSLEVLGMWGIDSFNSPPATFSTAPECYALAVLDEADTLLDMGFAEAITDILTKLPKQRRTGLFSATQTREVASLTRAGLRNPAVVSVKVQYDAPSAGMRYDDATRPKFALVYILQFLQLRLVPQTDRNLMEHLPLQRLEPVPKVKVRHHLWRITTLSVPIQNASLRS